MNLIYTDNDILSGDSARVLSAGSKPVGYVHPKAIQVMQEIGSLE